jgi:predicted ATP-dependent endonuclease of OLD family
VRTNLLFAKGVLLVEGDVEQILIPELVKKAFGISLDEIGISLVNIGSTGFENIAVLFHNDRLRKKCAIITDLDSSILKLPVKKEADSDEEKGCRNSQIAGLERKEKLDEFCSSNDWLKPFYGNYTFEVDFLMSNNSFEIKETVTKKYKREGDITRIHALLDNKDVSISGKEVMRLANAFGKGWFALMLAENISHLTFIPTHILEAIAYSSPHITTQTKKAIAKYRLESFQHNTIEGDKNDYAKLQEEFESLESDDDSVDYFLEKLPTDQLSTFIKILNK